MQELFKYKESEQYINLLQENINRMSSNSSNCKSWMLTIVSAILALGVSKEGLQNWAHLALLPAILFYLLDSFYLGIERRFIGVENNFIDAVKNGKDEKELLFAFKNGERWYTDSWNMIKAMFSISTILYYVPVIVFVLYLKWWM